MFTRGYAVNGDAITVGYKYDLITAEDEMIFTEKKLDHQILCADKITTLLKNWLNNCFVGFGILGVGLLAVVLVYLTFIFLMGGFF